MRRLLLVGLGLLGSLLAGWQLVVNVVGTVNNASALPHPACPAEVSQELLVFPYKIAGTDLTVLCPAAYEGGYVEDASGDYLVDVAALVLRNDGQVGVEQANITVGWDQGMYVFEATMLPPGESVLVLDKKKQKFAAHTWTRCEGTQYLAAEEWQCDSRLLVEDVDLGTIQVTNLTADGMENIRIYYKSYVPENEIYLGGATYSLGVQALAAGESKEISPIYYASGYSKVVACTEGK